MNETGICTYIKCNTHNTIVIKSSISNLRFIHAKSGSICVSTKFTLVRTTVLGREEAMTWADRIARGIEVGATNR
jgi:hypothetical protein